MSVDVIYRVQPEIFQKAKEVLGEDDDKREQTLRIIREWIAKQPHFRARVGNWITLNVIRLFHETVSFA